jgi:hypothetical protein
VIGSAFRLATRTSYEGRVRAAAMAAACVAFSVAAAFDWIWQVPVLPVAFLLLAASLLTPTKRASSSPPRRVAAVAVRAGIVVVAIACIVGDRRAARRHQRRPQEPGRGQRGEHVGGARRRA